MATKLMPAPVTRKRQPKRPGPIGGRFRDLPATVRERVETNESDRARPFGDFPLQHYEAGGAVIVHPIGGVGAISVRCPLTLGRLEQLGEIHFEVVTRTPERYPERAWVLRVGAWLEVEVVSADEDAGCLAAKECLPVTHVNGLERIPPMSFQELLTLGVACVTAAGEEPGPPEHVGADVYRVRRQDWEVTERTLGSPTGSGTILRRVPEAKSLHEKLRRLLHVRGTQWERHTGEEWDTKRPQLIADLLGEDRSSKDLDEDALSVLCDHLREDLEAAGFDVERADEEYAKRQAQREELFGSLSEAVTDRLDELEEEEEEECEEGTTLSHLGRIEPFLPGSPSSAPQGRLENGHDLFTVGWVFRPGTSDYVEPEERHAVTRRLCAAWNACLGVPTEDLESYPIDAGLRTGEGRNAYARLSMLSDGASDDILDDLKDAQRRADKAALTESYLVVLEETAHLALEFIAPAEFEEQATAPEMSEWRDEEFALHLVQEYGERKGRLILALMKALDREHHDRREEPSK